MCMYTYIAIHCHLVQRTYIQTESDLPISAGVKRLFLRHIKHDDEARGAMVVSRGDGVVAFLTSCVPQLYFDFLITPTKIDPVVYVHSMRRSLFFLTRRS